MIFIEKIKWFFVIIIVFIIVLSTNLIDKKNFNDINNAITSIYEDRLIAINLLYDMSNILYQKEIYMQEEDYFYHLKDQIHLNILFEEKISIFENTKLTIKEDDLFLQLKKTFYKLSTIENEDKTGSIDEKELHKSIVKELHNLIDRLVVLQVKEGENQFIQGNRSMYFIDFFTQVEIITLIILSILMQVIIFYKSPRK